MTKGISVSVAKSMAAQDREWQAESDLRTLSEARKIQADPARKRAAQALAQKRLADLKALTGK